MSDFIIFRGTKDVCQSGIDSIHSYAESEEYAVNKAREMSEQDENGDTWFQVVNIEEHRVVAEFGYEVP